MTAVQVKDDVRVVERALNKARKTFNDKLTIPLQFRINQLLNLKKGMKTLEKDITEAIKKDLGRDYFATWFAEISMLDYEIDHTVSNLKKWAAGIDVSTPMFLGPACSRVTFEPLGVVCIIGSWNFPLYTTVGPLIHAIAAGNCAVIKPSEISCNSLFKIKALITRWLDMNAFIAIEGAVEVAKTLTAQKFDLICFTGSTEKGRLVATAAA